jgi:hypothetical protein
MEEIHGNVCRCANDALDLLFYMRLARRMIQPREAARYAPPMNRDHWMLGSVAPSTAAASSRLHTGRRRAACAHDSSAVFRAGQGLCRVSSTAIWQYPLPENEKVGHGHHEHVSKSGASAISTRPSVSPVRFRWAMAGKKKRSSSKWIRGAVLGLSWGAQPSAPSRRRDRGRGRTQRALRRSGGHPSTQPVALRARGAGSPRVAAPHVARTLAMYGGGGTARARRAVPNWPARCDVDLVPPSAGRSTTTPPADPRRARTQAGCSLPVTFQRGSGGGRGGGSPPPRCRGRCGHMRRCGAGSHRMRSLLPHATGRCGQQVPPVARAARTTGPPRPGATVAASLFPIAPTLDAPNCRNRGRSNKKGWGHCR